MGALKKYAASLLCNICGINRPRDDFYVGVTSRCRECHKAAIRAARADNPEQYREYDRERAFTPERVAARKAYRDEMKSDPDFVYRQRERGKFWQDTNMVKRRAHIMTGNAIRDGYLQKPQSCARCLLSDRAVHAHHENYYKPLEVVWLCVECHGARHREINAELRAGADLSCRGFKL